LEWESILPVLGSFLPPFFGVLAAFMLQWTAKKYDRGKDRKQFLQETRKELEACSQGLLSSPFANILPIDMWESGKASGFLSLISHEVKFQLAEIYFRIKCHNYEAEKVRDVDIIAQTENGKKTTNLELKGGEQTIPLREWTKSEKFVHYLAVELRKGDQKLKKDIDDLLKQQKIWN